MIVEKCKKVMMEERRGRRRAHRMAREVSGALMNPVSTVGGVVAGAAESTASLVGAEEMSGGAKVLLLLAVAGVIGGGAYWYFTKPAAAATPSTTPPPTGGAAAIDPNAVATTVGGNQLTWAQLATLSASLLQTTLAQLQASGITSAQLATLSPIAQQAMSVMGVKVV